MTSEIFPLSARAPRRSGRGVSTSLSSALQRVLRRTGAILGITAVLLGTPAIAAIPENIVANEFKLDPAQLDPEWTTLLDFLRGQKTVRSTFIEHRYTPLKKTPLEFTGQMRLAQERGLSLHYLTPEERTLVIDDRGLVMRDARGRSREVAPDPRMQATTTMLLRVLRLDLTRLTQDFDVFGARDGLAWRLVFEPKASAVGRNAALGRIVVHGQQKDLLILELRKSDKQRIEIQIESTETNVVFSPDELTQFFR